MSRFRSIKRPSKRSRVFWRAYDEVSGAPTDRVREFGPAAILTQNGSGKAAEAQDGRRDGGIEVPSIAR